MVGRPLSCGFTASGAPPAGQLTIVQAFDTTTGSRASPGSAFGGDATLANNFFNAVDEACNNFQNWFCAGTARTIHIQFGYGTLSNTPFSDGASGSNWGQQQTSYANLRTALNTNALTAIAQSAYNSLAASDPTSGTGVGINTTHAVALGIAGGDSLAGSAIGLNASFTWFWTQASPTGDFDAVGFIMHEISECMGRIGTGAGTYSNVDVLDLFSYASAGVPQIGHSGYFSYDGGNTGSGNPWGSGSDARDWNGIAGDCCSHAPGTGLQTFTTLDKNVMDSVGWEWNGL